MADDRSDLRDRVAELEATVEQQQATIQKLLPSRRRVLQAGGLVAGGGVLGALTADRASADVTGQVGTSQDRVDVFAGAVDANSVNTDTIATTGLAWEFLSIGTGNDREQGVWYQAPEYDIVLAIQYFPDNNNQINAIVDVNTTQSKQPIHTDQGSNRSGDVQTAIVPVPADFQYRFRTQSGSVTLLNWIELR
jgi:hypothetical protein